MSTGIRQGDMVGMFYEYSQTSCVYLGLAEYIGEKDAPECGLAIAGKFDGRHVEMSSRISTNGHEKQMAFSLPGEGETIYEQESWYCPQAKVQRLLDGCEEVREGNIEDFRALEVARIEQEKSLPSVVSGHLEAYVTFRNLPTPDDYDLDNDDRCFPEQQIIDALVGIGFDEKLIDIKVRSLDEHKRGR